MSSQEFAPRAEALWWLIDLGPAALEWCEAALNSGDEDRIEDAAGVLAWIGTPDHLVPVMTAHIERFGDSQVADALHLALPPDVTALEDDAAAGEPEGARLLGGGREPFTQGIGFIQAPRDAVVATIREGYEATRTAAKISEHRGGIRELLDLLEPYCLPSWAQLVVDTDSDWTALFGQGGDAPVEGLVGRLRTRGVRTSASPHVVRDGRVLRYGDVAMWLYDGRRDDLAPLYYLRVIQASFQTSRWDWQLSGEVQPFEDVTRYDRRRVRERFDLAALNEYCEALGIRRADAAFYGPQATLIQLDTSTWSTQPTGMPSAEWRRQHS